MKSFILLLALLLSARSFAYKQFDDVTIGDPKRTEITAALELFSKTKGFLVPRMTTVERDLIVLPATALQIYNESASRIEIYNGASWVSIGGSTLQGAYDDSVTGTIVLDGTRNTFRVMDNGTPIGVNLFDVQDNGASEVFGVTITAANTIQLNIDGNLRLDNASLSAQVLNSDITIQPNGTGQVNISSNLDVTGDVQATSANIDNVRIDGNVIDTTDVNGNLELSANGTGLVVSQKKHIFNTETSNTVPVFDGTKQLVSSLTTTQELSYLNTTTQDIQVALNSKAELPIDLTADVSSTILPIANGGTNSSTVLSNDLVMVSTGGALVESATTVTELTYLNTTTQDIQVALNSKAELPIDLTSDIGSTILPIANGGTGSSTKVFTDLTTDQTLDGLKTFDKELTLLELGATPSTPSAGDKKIYCKTDDKCYQLNDAGTEVELGAGGGGGGGLPLYLGKVVGDATDVTNGDATHSSITSAIAAATAGDRITLLARTFTETVNVNKEVHIVGSGRKSLITGNVTFSASNSSAKALRYNGDITVNITAIGMILTDSWLVTGKTLTDNNTTSSGSLYLILEE